jgi:hypothetical protein
MLIAADLDMLVHDHRQAVLREAAPSGSRRVLLHF